MEINRYEFKKELVEVLDTVYYAKNAWPVVYLLNDDKDIYIGETADTKVRMNTHLNSPNKNHLTTVYLITSDKFNKSATLDIESSLIRYIAADGKYQLLNSNLGLANHNYYQKQEVYSQIFKSIWDKLRAQGITQHSLRYIDNSDLFKYSPYKSLEKEQKTGLLVIMDSLLDDTCKNIVIEGGAGTGKTILAVFLFKLLHTSTEELNFQEFDKDESLFRDKTIALKKKYPTPKMGLVVPMSSFRATLQKVFKNIKGLKANMVIGPSEVADTPFDILLVDESHRLRRRVNLGTYFGSFDKACSKLKLDKDTCSEVDWIVAQSQKAIFFYDESQSIKPSDTRKEVFTTLKSKKSTRVEYLKSQFRVKGGNNYVTYIEKLLNCQLPTLAKKFQAKEYEFFLFDSIDEMIQEIKRKNTDYGLSRLIAGYAWEWVSQNDSGKFDITIEETNLRWNSQPKDWINSPNAIYEVGCIHTTQGYDLNYAGIIFGNEITYDESRSEIVILKDKYYDRNGKQSVTDPEELKAFIINIYKTIMLRGIRGTYVYVCDEKLRKYFSNYIPSYKSSKEIEADDVIKILPFSEVDPYKNAIPLYNLRASAGDFSDLQHVEEYDWIKLPSHHKPSKDLFACKVEGESMNKVIPNGSICLFRKDMGGSRNGKIVLVQHTHIQDPESGSSYTVKEYESKKVTHEEGWSHESIRLKPFSTDSDYKAIELLPDEASSLQVIGIYECVLGNITEK